MGDNIEFEFNNTSTDITNYEDSLYKILYIFLLISIAAFSSCLAVSIYLSPSTWDAYNDSCCTINHLNHTICKTIHSCNTLLTRFLNQHNTWYHDCCFLWGKIGETPLPYCDYECFQNYLK